MRSIINLSYVKSMRCDRLFSLVFQIGWTKLVDKWSNHIGFWYYMYWTDYDGVAEGDLTDYRWLLGPDETYILR